MTDPRFWSVCDELDELIATVDIDGSDDLGTLLMFLLARPVGVDDSWNEDAESFGLEISIAGNDRRVVLVQGFPMSVVQLVRACAETAAALGPYTADAASSDESPDFRTSSDEELTTALQKALGEVRMFKLMYADEDDA